MAIFNEILEGRFNRFLQKFFAIKGGPPVRQLGSEIMPVFQIFNGVENRWLEGWQQYGFVTVQAAGGAGVPSGVRLRNPVGSNVLAVITKIRVHIGVVVDNGVGLFIGRQTAAIAGIESPLQIALDPRQSGIRSTCLLSQGNVVGGSGFGSQLLNEAFTAVVGGGSHQPDRDFLATNDSLVLLPGDAVQVETGPTANVLDVAIRFFERAMTESERA